MDDDTSTATTVKVKRYARLNETAHWSEACPVSNFPADSTASPASRGLSVQPASDREGISVQIERRWLLCFAFMPCALAALLLTLEHHGGDQPSDSDGNKENDPLGRHLLSITHNGRVIDRVSNSQVCQRCNSSNNYSNIMTLLS